MSRDDLFTSIHKGLRKGLFDLTVQAGRADWDDPVDVADLRQRWSALRSLLEGHSEHEDRHIFRLLDTHDATALGPVEADHVALDHQLTELDTRFDAAFATPGASLGLDAYRALTLFVAAYLAHIHREETDVMRSIWQQCSDEEIASARAGFMAEITPDHVALSLELMLDAVEPATRAALVARTSAASASTV